MTIFSEFIVLHGDDPMPEDETFMPSFWKAEDFDADGDFYATGLGGRWTELRLSRRRKDGGASVLWVNTLREGRAYEPGLQETADLQRFLDYDAAGRYDRGTARAGERAVTSLAIETDDVDEYAEFLRTVDGFLERSGGLLVSPRVLDQGEFAERFLAS